MLDFTKDTKVDVMAVAPGMDRVDMGISWNPGNVRTGTRVDVDSISYALDANMKLMDEDTDVSYFKNKAILGGAIHLDKDSTSGDSSTGGSDIEGVPDENTLVTLSKLPDRVKYVVQGAYIFSGAENFGEVSGCYADFRSMDHAPNAVPNTPGFDEAVAKGDVKGQFYLTKDYNEYKAVALMTFHRKDDGAWEIMVFGRAFGSLNEMNRFFGAKVKGE